MKAPLDDIQQRFADAMRDPDNESSVVGQLSTSADIAARRLDVYRGNAQAHWRVALADAYPVLRALTGETYFSALARAYVRVFPSRSGDLNQFGAKLAAFISDWERNSRYDYFGDVARLEWAVHTAWYAADAMALSAQQWQQTSSERLLANRLAVHPACAAMHSRHAIADIWRAHQANGTPPERIDRPVWILVVRPHWRPFVVDQSRAAHEAFIALQGGRTLNEAIDIALGVDPCFDISTQLKSWIEVSAITGLATR
ncbi:DNA-binding domain-containing protein [Paraburkholderia humisilvae]|uniref:Putative DNA-binding domain-containing protein n=1 Tax=Paraburkholderia humisilvae TaxID=627669 RepID=A0A6J5D6N7_9BURK|nr:DNA-binding domain-containing protein [Paraburkholderia humisilvae]CAB3749024.1 hypothetical protein LMG29542_00834 [Paraburkholderia humisilvae]